MFETIYTAHPGESRDLGHVGPGTAMLTFDIMTNRRNGVRYTGMTDDINRRAWMHREHVLRATTDRYDREVLVWHEVHDSRESAFVRGRRIKDWKRAWKITLIEEMNPDWRDLASDGI